MNFSPPASSEPRPPTPPKERDVHHETLDGLIHFLDASTRLDAAPLHELGTPPPSSSPLTSSPLKAGAKKIRFVAQPSLIDTPQSNAHALLSPAPLRPLPPSRHQRSSRSILKPYDNSSPQPSSDDADALLGNATTSDFSSCADMLDAITKGLASTTYTSRIDAYQLLLKCFRAYRNFPDPQALLARIPFLEDVVQRDMHAISAATQGPDAKLIGQATKVIANLLWDSKTSTHLSQSFVDAVMAQCIAVAEAPKLPKEVVKNQLFLLTIDRFLARACTPPRAASIITALVTVHERVTGDHILAIRLLILQQFVHCAPTTLALQAHEWLPCIFHGIMSSAPDVRSVAITTGAMCSTALGSTRQITVAVKDHLEQQSLGSGNNFDQFYHRLEEMIQDAEDARRVPGIWSIVILMLRGGKQSLASWPRLSQWFKIIQICLNKSDNKLNLEAWIAWNNFIFAVNPSLTTPLYLRKVLVKPIIAKLQSHARTEPARRVRDAAFSSLSLLLYYAFRPGCSGNHITLYWTEFVLEVAQNARMTSRKDFDRLVEIFGALLSNPDTGVWNVDRYAPSCTDPVKAIEIPRIDPAWTRANIDVATELVEHLVSMQLPLQGQYDFAQRMWKGLLRAVTEAGSREVKSSPALKRAVAEVLNLFARLTKRITIGDIRTASPDSALDCICDMADAIRCIQPSNFTEKCVTRSESGIYGVPQTPLKSRQSDGQMLQTPLIALLQMINPLVKAATPHSDGLEALDTLISACVGSLSTRKAKLQLLKSCAKAVCGAPGLGRSQPCQSSLWNCIASSTMSVMAVHGTPAPLHDVGRQLHQDYEACLFVAKQGLGLTSLEDCKVLAKLVSTLVNTAQKEAGDAAALVCIVAPLSLAVICCHPRSGLDAPLVTATALLGTPLSAPSDRTLRSAAKYLLPPEENPTNWSFALFNMTNRLLHEAGKRAQCRAVHLEKFFSVLTKFSRSALCNEPKELLIQCHIGISQCAKLADGLPKEFVPLWASFLDSLAKHVTRDSRNLAMHEILFISGFTSNSRVIARTTIDCWNATFGLKDDLTYSDALKSHLERLAGIAHILYTPSEREDDVASASVASIDFDTTYPWTMQDAEQDPEDQNGGFGSIVPYMEPERRRDKVFGALSIESNNARPSPKAKHLPSALPAKLRHDDSQLQFVPIESSPLNADAEESQNLTEHQKDVRSRQDQEGALYADLRSSPASAVKRSLLPARLLDFGKPPQETAPDAPAVDVELDISAADDIYDIPMSPSQQRSERRFDKREVQVSTWADPEDFDNHDSIYQTPDDERASSDIQVGKALDENAIQGSPAGNPSVRLPADEGDNHDDHDYGTNNKNRDTTKNNDSDSDNDDNGDAPPGGKPRAKDGKQETKFEQTEQGLNENDGVVAVQDSFPTPLKSPTHKICDSFIGPTVTVQVPRLLRMTSHRACRLDTAHSTPAPDAPGSKKRKATASQDSQRKRKETKTPRSDQADQVDQAANVTSVSDSDDEVEIIVEAPNRQPRQSTSQAIGRGGASQATQRSSVGSGASDHGDALTRRSDRRRRRSRTASSDDDKPSGRPRKATKAAGSNAAVGARPGSQRRKSIGQAGSKAQRGRRSSGQSKGEATEHGDALQQVKDEPEAASGYSHVEASQDGENDGVGDLGEGAAQQHAQASDGEVEIEAANRLDEAQEGNQPHEAEVAAPSTPLRTVEASVPASPIFSPAMSEKAHAFLNRMRDMYRQCKELVLGVEDQTIMDEMEDVHEMLGKEIQRVGRRGRGQSG